MKKKINRQLCAVVLGGVFITLVLTVLVFYNLFQEQVMADLKAYTQILSESGLLTEEKFEDVLADEGFRITLIDPDGNVRYDNRVDTQTLDNHAARPEVMGAWTCGEGESIRRSSTVGQNTFNYAILLQNGDVLRVSQLSHSVWSLFFTAMPYFILLVAAAVALCVLLSRYLTRSLVAPIEELGKHMDDMEDVETYEELKPFVQTIRNQHEAIMESAQMRQEFTANVSHELKTPLTAISGYSELIENGMADEQDITRFAAGIHKNAKRLLTLINDTIRLSELDAASEVPFETLNLYDIAATSVDMLQINAENHDVSLYLEGESCEMKGDRQMMEELLYNLCDNAIRYNNKDGKVWIRVSREAAGEVCLQVKDTGIGIPKEHQERIFERFYRVDKSRSKSTGGTGLGLAIVKHIVVKHGARLELDSTVGKGTTIRIFFPAI